MSVLLSGHGADEDALAAARRLTPYSRLVLVSSAPRSPEAREIVELERLAGVAVELRGVDADDFLSCLATARGAIDDYRREDLRVHVAGGPNLVASALLLAAFQRGVPAFFCHPRGVCDLPVAVAIEVDDRFGPAERAVLVALPPEGEAAVAAIEPPGVSPAAVKGALLRLRAKGLVRANAARAALTSVGAYYREHFTA